MTYEDWIIAVAAEAPRRSGSALKLLLHLASISIQSGTTQLRLSDRDLQRQLGMAAQTMTDAKRNLSDLVAIVSRPGVPTCFDLPATWFPGQRTLFSQQVSQNLGHNRPTNQGTTVPESRAALSQNPGQVSQKLGRSAPENGAAVPQKMVQVSQNLGQTALESRAPATENQQLAGDGDDRSRSIDLSTTTGKYVKIDLVLDCVEIPSSLRSDAELLRNNLWVYAQQRGSGSIAERQPSDEVVAKCLSIGGVDSLLIALGEAANYKNSRPASYWWFIAVFLEKLYGIPPSMLRERLDSRRLRKQPRRAELLPFPDQLVQQAAGQVKTLR